MIDNPKKILIVDDSALMRRVIYDIIQSDDRFVVQNMAANGEDAMALIQENEYDAVVLDIEMPKMDGLSVLQELKAQSIPVSVVVFSGASREGTDITIRALELGAIDFINKPSSLFETKKDVFVSRFLEILYSAATSPKGLAIKAEPVVVPKKPELSHKNGEKKTGAISWSEGQIVAIASSTGGPKALQEVIPLLPEDFPVPVLIVQHMPAGFTASLAKRLDDLSQIKVKEARDGEALMPGTAYIAKGGLHMEVKSRGDQNILVLRDGPTREGVKPCANYMYESLGESSYDSIVCVVLTGMGADGTEGIVNLSKKRKVFVVSQDQATSVVYGMPRCIADTGIVNRVEPINQVAQAIIKSVGVQ